MKRLILVLCTFLLLSGSSFAQVNPMPLGSLALPADKILRISTSLVEFEHHGLLPIQSEVEAYQHWEDDVWPIPLAAVLVGFEKVVPTIFAGEIIRFDVYDPLYIRTMRVAITTEQFRSTQHQELIFAPTSKLYIEENGTGRGLKVEAGETVVVFVKEGKLQIKTGEGQVWEFDRRLELWPDIAGQIQINSFKRGNGNTFYPCYRGRFEVVVADSSTFLAINEVSLEDYLYQVVPSEMPINWPLEALKAQAVAARTYAVAQVIYSRQGHLGFHVTDSTSSQVYNNHQEAAQTSKSIQETEGQILAKEDGTIGSTYFHSTSPGGPLTDLSLWKNTEGLKLEGNSPWYRWKCTFSEAELGRLLDPLLGDSLGEIKGLEVEERDWIGRVTALSVQGTAGVVSIRGELNIRSALRPASLERIKDTLGRQSLLPSAHFFLEQEYDAKGQLKSITFYGGGCGHGLGLSQWGAKGMAEMGSDYVSILGKYYPDTHLITHSEQLRY